MPRLYREAPLNSIWEGSGNVIALDVLRALARQPASLEAFFAEVEPGRRRRRPARRLRGASCRRSSPTPRSSRRAPGASSSGWRSRLQGSLLVRHAPPAVADAFCASRLAGDARPGATGRCPPGVDTEAIVARHTPAA